MAHLNDIVNGLNSITYDQFSNDWHETVSGKIYSALVKVMEQSDQTVVVEGEGSLHEIFKVGQESASLFKRLRAGTVGEEGGTIETYAEGWEYKRLSWWQKALDKAKMPIIFLDVPIYSAAADAGIAESKDYFVPAFVVRKYHLSPSNGLEEQILMEHWVKENVKKALDASLAPDFRVREYEGFLRLYPQNEDAKLSKVSDNLSYDLAKDRIKSALPVLQKMYEEKERQVKNQS